MPQNPLDLLKRGWQAANTPVVDKETIQPYQDMMDAPALDRGPMEARMRGFGAGAMEGIRQLATPLNMGMAAAGPALGMLRGGKAAHQMMNSLTLDLVESNPVKQVAPAMDDVNALIGDLRRNLASLPKRPAPMETLGERAAEFAPVGSEGMFNVGAGMAKVPGQEGIYPQMLNKLGGRGK